MADEKVVTTNEQSVETTGVAGTTQQVQATGETPEQMRESIAKLEAAMKKANSEAASSRRKVEAYEAEQAARVEAGKTESQKLADQIKALQADRDAALARASETLIRSSVISEAAKLQFRDPADALRLIDKAALTVDGDKVDGITDQLQALAKAKPYLLATTMLGHQSPSNPGNGAQQGKTREQMLAEIYGSGQTSIGSKAGGGGFIPFKE